MNRYLLLSAALFAANAPAANISGTSTISASAPGMFGTVDVTATVSLSCSLTCPPAAPTLHFGISGLSRLAATGDPTVDVTYVSVGFATGVDPGGSSTAVFTNVPAGSSFALVNKSATCFCGGRTGEGGYVDVVSNTLSVPPFINSSLIFSPGQVGQMSAAVVGAFPTGAEKVTVTLKGAGLDQTLMLGAADCDSSHDCKVAFTPPAAGDLVVTATTAQGLSHTRTFPITGSGSTGGGGGTTGTGGGGGRGGGTEPPPAGCSQVPGALVAALLALLRRRG